MVENKALQLADTKLWIVGDPHGDFRRVIALALERKPAAVVFLGDLELPAPAEEVFYPLVRTGIAVRFIHGNHDADDPDLWRRLADGPLAPSFNLNGRVEEIAGRRVAGLGGIFHGRVWRPPEAQKHQSYADLDRSLEPHWWTPAQRLQNAPRVANERVVHRASIFPDVYDALARQDADVLVTHEAPGGLGMHPYGFEAIADLAEFLGARIAFHGHHHEYRRYQAVEDSCRWIGVGMLQIVDGAGNPVA